MPEYFFLISQDKTGYWGIEFSNEDKYAVLDKMKLMKDYVQTDDFINLVIICIFDLVPQRTIHNLINNMNYGLPPAMPSWSVKKLIGAFLVTGLIWFMVILFFVI